jgi:hypothetical protein
LDWAFAGWFFALDTAGAAKTPNWTKALKLAEEKPNTSAARGHIIWGSSIASGMKVSSHANLTGSGCAASSLYPRLLYCTPIGECRETERIVVDDYNPNARDSWVEEDPTSAAVDHIRLCF